jgi:hypothetical protein
MDQLPESGEEHEKGVNSAVADVFCLQAPVNQLNRRNRVCS